MPAVNANGYDLFYADDDFAEPWRPHDAILMQHYILGNHTEFRPWVPILAREFRVLRLDRRGNGLSAKPPFTYQYTLDDLIADFVGFLDALELERVHYIGQSLGGVLGAVFAARHPERVKSLVLAATPCFINEQTQRSLSRPGFPDGPAAVMGMGSHAYAHSGWLANRRPTATVWDELGAQYRAEQTAMMPAHVIASLERMVSQPDFDITALLPSIKAPTLLLSPGASVPTSLEQQEMMLASIPECEQVIFEGAAHGIVWDQPERCAKESLRFIRKHAGSQAPVLALS
jgi:pimeloyl-ACP methyl ester carboxylesterase